MMTVPQTTDTRLTRWKKFLTVWQQSIAPAPYASNDPKETDTLRITLVKLLRAINNVGDGGICCPPAEAPIDPCVEAGAVAVTNFAGEVIRGTLPTGYISTFTWTPSSIDPNDIIQYNLYRADFIGGPYLQVAAPANTDTSASDAGDALGPVQPNTNYYYKLETLFQESVGCPNVETDPIIIAGGCHVVDVTLTNTSDVGSDSLTLTWVTDPVDTNPLLEFFVEWGTTQGGPYTDSLSVAATERTTGITGLNPSTHYYFRVTARDSLICTDSGPEADAITEPA